MRSWTIAFWLVVAAGCSGPSVGAVRDAGGQDATNDAGGSADAGVDVTATDVANDSGVVAFDGATDVNDVGNVDERPDVVGADGADDAGREDVADAGTDASDVTTADAVGDTGGPLSDGAADAPVDAVRVDVAVDAGPPDAGPPDAGCEGPASGVCHGSCVSLSTMTDCGACDRSCTSAQTCVSGRCMDLSCPAGMRFIPAGQFLMGDAMLDNLDAQPVHGVRLSAFCMDDTEVTVSAYASCPIPGYCSEPNREASCNWGVAGREGHPVNCVDWSQSRAYCQWRGGELPTEAQWEYAARGATDQRPYPWGFDAPGPQLCWNRMMSSTTCPVRSYPTGNSPFGLSDMAGNVWEWTFDRRGNYAGNASSYVLNPTGPGTGGTRVYRGGSWYDDQTRVVRSMTRFDHAPTLRSIVVGFRCARQPTACTIGFGDCDGTGANGCEVDTRTNNSHCGACGNACRAGQLCTSGGCAPGS